MAFIPVPNTVRLSLVFTLAGQTVVITLHAWKSGAVTLTDQQNLCAEMRSWWDTYLKLHCNNGMALQEINSVDLTSDSSPSYSLPVSPPIVGGVSEAAVPNNVAACISFRTASRGRSYRGRMFVPGMRNSYAATPTTLSAAAQSWLAVAAANLGGYLALHGFTQVIASRFHNNAPRVVGIVTPVLSAIIDDKLDSQRRRLAGRGV